MTGRGPASPSHRGGLHAAIVSLAFLLVLAFPAHGFDPRYALNFGIPATHWNEAQD